MGTGLVLVGILPPFLVASLAILIRQDFPLSDSSLGLAIGVAFGVAALASPLAGRLVDRVGFRRGMLLGGSLAIASSCGIGWLAHSGTGLVAFLSLGGLSMALSGPSTGALIAHSMDPARRGLAFGVQQAGAPAGALLAGLALPLIGAPLGWRAAFFLAAAMAGGVLIAAASRDPKVQDEAGLPPKAAPSHSRQRWSREANLAAVATALASGAAAAMLSFVVVFTVDDVGFAERPAGFLLAATSLISIATRVVLGVIADRRPGAALTHIAAITMVGGLGFLMLAIAEPVTVVAGALVVGGIGWGWTGLAIFVLVRANPDAPAGTVAILMMGVFAGAGGGPLLAGLLTEVASFRITWLCGASLAIVAATLFVAAARAQADTRNQRPGIAGGEHGPTTFN